MTSQNRIKGLAAALVMTLLFGASFVGSKVALSEFSPFELLFLRFLIGSLLFLISMPFLKTQTIVPRDRIKLLILCLMEPGLYFYLEAMGLQRTEAGMAAMLICTIPIYVLILEVIWLKLRFMVSEVILILLSISGTVLLVLAGGTSGLSGGKLAGNLFILGAALAASVYTVMVGGVLKKYRAVTVTKVQNFYAVLFYAPFFTWDVISEGGLHASTRSWIAVLYLGVGCSFFAYLFLNVSLSYLKPSLVSTFANLIPVVAAGLAVLILGERFTWLQITASSIVIISVFWLAWRKPKEKPPVITQTA